MFPTYPDISSLNDRIRPDRRHLRTASEIRMRVRHITKAA
jgi:hypothetical protein